MILITVLGILNNHRLLGQTDENRGGTWVFEIKFLLYSLGSVGNVVSVLNEFKQRLIDTSGQIWHTDFINNCIVSVIIGNRRLSTCMYWKHRGI